jgi:hypothetical protein
MIRRVSISTFVAFGASDGSTAGISKRDRIRQGSHTPKISRPTNTLISRFETKCTPVAFGTAAKDGLKQMPASAASLRLPLVGTEHFIDHEQMKFIY